MTGGPIRNPAPPTAAAEPLSVLLLGYMHDRGGIQTHTRHLARGLRERGHRVAVVSPPPMQGHRDARHDEPDLAVYGGLADLVRRVRAARPDVAVVTGTGYAAMAGILAARVPRKVFFEVMSGARGRGLDPRDLVHLGFDAVVGQARPVTARFVDVFRWRGPASTIPALPEPLERRHAIAARAMRPLAPGAPLRFAFFSRLAPHKNAALLVARFADYAPPGSTLDIWGSGPEAGPLEAMIAAQGLSDRVRLKGPYPDGADYVALLSSYDLTLLPTVGEEGAPLVLLESMACGVPFVANGVGGIPDYANPDCAVTDGDIEAFVPMLQEMVARLHAGTVDGARLQRHHAENFGFITLIDRWERFLLEQAGR